MRIVGPGGNGRVSRTRMGCGGWLVTVVVVVVVGREVVGGEYFRPAEEGADGGVGARGDRRREWEEL